MSREQINIVVGIVTYNNSETIAECIAAVKLQKIVTQIVVVDNNSTDETVALLRKMPGKIRLISNSENHGYAFANNQILTFAKDSGCNYLLLLNPDAFLRPGVLHSMIETAKEHADLCIVGAAMYTQHDLKTWWGTAGLLDIHRYSALLAHHAQSANKLNKNEVAQFISGTCMLLPQTLIATGLTFYTKYFMYYEDVEFCIRAARFGFSSIVSTRAQLVHAERSEQDIFKSKKQYYLARNHLLFVERNAPLKIRIREFLRMPKTVYEHVKTHNKYALLGIRDYFLRHFNRL